MKENLKTDLHGYFKVGPSTLEKKQYESKGDVFFEFILGVASLAAYFGIKDYFKKKQEKRQKEEQEAAAAQDPENLAMQKDKEVKVRISKLLGLYDTYVPQVSNLGGGCKRVVEYLVDKIIKVGDRLVIVSPPGQGKSLWVTQVALCIAQGVVPEFLCKGSKPCKPQKVIVYDAELDDDDMSGRYGNLPVIPNIERFANCKFRTIYYLIESIYSKVIGLGSDCTIILDNLFALMPTMTTEETRIFLNGLDIIQRKVEESGHKLTYIIVSHTVKDVVGVPDMKDVAGSAHISRFAKSVMSICRIPGKENLTALITNKRRYAPGKDNVLMRISNNGYTHFEHVGLISYDELSRLKNGGEHFCDDDESKGKGYDDDLRLKIFNWHTESKPVSFRDIEKRLNEEGIKISHTEVRNQYLTYCEESGIDPDHPKD